MGAEVDGQRLVREEVMNIIFVLVFAGLDTVSASLSCFVAWFARHPRERQRVIDDPSLLPQAIEELLRYESPVHCPASRLPISRSAGSRSVLATH